MRKQVNRRHITGAILAMLGVAVASEQTGADEAQPAQTCYWRYVESICSGGTIQERWCYRCCGPTGCEDRYCEWRDAENC